MLPENQDTWQIHEPTAPLAPHGRLYVLADGMGGHAAGQLASQTAVAAFSATFYRATAHQPLARLKAAMNAANLAVQRAAARLNQGRIGTTLTALNLVGNRLYLAHIGDSRAYLVRDQRAQCLTNDHTQVGDLVRMKVLTPAQVRSHPRRSLLSQALGLDLFVQPELAAFALRADDRLLLCCDGVWAVLEDAELAQVLCATPAPEASEQLVQLALARGSDDNVSAIVLHLEQLAEPAATPAGPWWQAFWPPKKPPPAAFTTAHHPKKITARLGPRP